MTDNLGTLAGLIADLEKEHWAEWGLASSRCPSDEQTWPCPTIELVRKHKRAQYWIAYYPKEGLHSVHSGHGFDEDWHYSGKTREEAEAWVDRQVNG